MPTNAYAAVITCIDGTVREPVIEWATRWLDIRADDIYWIAPVSGPDKVLADGDAAAIDEFKRNEIKRLVLHAANNHNLEALVVVGHQGCTGNPAPRSQQVKQIRQGVLTVCSWYSAPVVIGVWVDSIGNVDVVCEVRDGRLSDLMH